MNPFQSLREYEEFVYTLKQRFSVIQRSTLVVIRRGTQVAVLQGELTFDHGYRINLKERLSSETGSVVIKAYGYELWRDADKISWYDSQPHPDDPRACWHSPASQAYSPGHKASPYPRAGDEFHPAQYPCAGWGN